jgi:hypothetical protein
MQRKSFNKLTPPIKELKAGSPKLPLRATLTPLRIRMEDLGDHRTDPHREFGQVFPSPLPMLLTSPRTVSPSRLLCQEPMDGFQCLCILRTCLSSSIWIHSRPSILSADQDQQGLCLGLAQSSVDSLSPSPSSPLLTLSASTVDRIDGRLLRHGIHSTLKTKTLSRS